MPVTHSNARQRLRHSFVCAAVVVLSGGQLFCQDPPLEVPASRPASAAEKSFPKLPAGRQLRVFKANPLIVSDAPVWSADQTPADFLDGVGVRLKARWRQLYRQPPPPPPTDRQRAAFSLGALLADCYLSLQATDAQQFKNTSHDVLGYCRVLALGEKVTPRIMSAAKLAEAENWVELRHDVVDGHQEVCRLLREQRDDDLATLVDLGVWLRMVELVATLVVEAKDPLHWHLATGSPELARELSVRFDSMSQLTRTSERMLKLGEVTDYLARTWGPVDQRPDQADVIKTHERVALLLRTMTLK
jgi:hypothetical protein